MLVPSSFHFPARLRAALPFVLLGTFLLHGPGRRSCPFSRGSVMGNLVTVLNLKFWHSCGGAIHLLARHPARGFSRNPLIVLNADNIYIHCDEAKFTAGRWGWLQHALIPDFPGLRLPCRAPREQAAAGGHTAVRPPHGPPRTGLVPARTRSALPAPPLPQPLLFPWSRGPQPF